MRPLDRMGSRTRSSRRSTRDSCTATSPDSAAAGHGGGDRPPTDRADVRRRVVDAGFRGGDGRALPSRHPGRRDDGKPAGAGRDPGAARAKRTGEGQYIEVTMLDAARRCSCRGWRSTSAGMTHQPQGSSAFAAAPDRAFPCEDAHWIGVSVTSEAQWRRFCDLLAKPELRPDPRFATNAARVEHRGALQDLLAADFASKPRAYWSSSYAGRGALRHADAVGAPPRPRAGPRERLPRGGAHGRVGHGVDRRTAVAPLEDAGADGRSPIPGIDTDELSDDVERARAGEQ